MKSVQSWVSEELKCAALPDKRLNQRLIKIVEYLAQQPNASIHWQVVIGQGQKRPTIFGNRHE